MERFKVDIRRQCDELCRFEPASPDEVTNEVTNVVQNPVEPSVQNTTPELSARVKKRGRSPTPSDNEAKKNKMESTSPPPRPLTPDSEDEPNNESPPPRPLTPDSEDEPNNEPNNESDGKLMIDVSGNAEQPEEQPEGTPAESLPSLEWLPNSPAPDSEYWDNKMLKLGEGEGEEGSFYKWNTDKMEIDDKEVEEKND